MHNCIIVTGCAGFIGAATVQALLQANKYDRVVGIDNLNDYYDVKLKQARLELIASYKNFNFHHADLKNVAEILTIFKKYQPTQVLNLAAQAGVRYSIENPSTYIDSNMVGFFNILEACRQFGIQHLVYASSSSVYGANASLPYSEHESTDHPLSLYAATKKSNELLAHTYSHLFNLPVTGLRYFTVYGPWGRPDMAPIRFVEKILAGQAIPIYNNGNHQRDFSYIDDIVEMTIRALDKIPQKNPNWNRQKPDPATSDAPYRVYNFSYGSSRELLNFIELLEQSLGRKAIKDLLPKQPGDVEATWANTVDAQTDLNYKPKIPLEEGIPRFVAWYKQFYTLR